MAAAMFGDAPKPCFSRAPTTAPAEVPMKDLQSQDRFPDERNHPSNQVPKLDRQSRRHRARVPAIGDLQARPCCCQIPFYGSVIASKG
jgi:hypothetical protein